MSQENVIYFKKGILKTKYPYKMYTQKKKKCIRVHAKLLYMSNSLQPYGL